MELTLDQLKVVMPRMARNPNTAAALFPHLVSAMVEAQITTKLRIAAFLAQVAHESCEFRYMEELASGEAYEGRQDLGNTEPGDGPRYKGRGPIQLTGRVNYEKCGQALGVDLVNQPELAATNEVAFRVAGWFWTTRHLNVFADAQDFESITKRINGGLNGYAARLSYYQRALEALLES